MSESEEHPITKYFKTKFFISKFERNQMYLYIDGDWISSPTMQLPQEAKEITKEEAFLEILLGEE